MSGGDSPEGKEQRVCNPGFEPSVEAHPYERRAEVEANTEAPGLPTGREVLPIAAADVCDERLRRELADEFLDPRPCFVARAVPLCER